MSLFNRALRPPPTVSDEAVERYLAKLYSELEPDPLFHRRLRTDVVNRFVAAREGMIDRPARSGSTQRRMGRVGRACLYASLTLGASAVSVLAASQEALPGEVLYPLKQRIEHLRMEAAPEQLRDEVAAYALGERIEEMVRLAESDRVELAIAMAPGIDREYHRLEALGRTVDAAGAVRIEHHLLVLQGLLAKLPEPARVAVENVIAGTPGNGQEANPGNTGGAKPVRGGGPATGSGPNATVNPAPTPKAERTPKPEPTVTPSPSPMPDASPKASHGPPVEPRGHSE